MPSTDAADDPRGAVGGEDLDTHPIARPPGWRRPGSAPPAASARPSRTPVEPDRTPRRAEDGVRRSRDEGQGHGPDGSRRRRRGSSWRELPVLVVVAVVLTFLIQTFVGRPYEIPSGSMERTLHGCTGCTDDRVAADKITYRFSDPAPGDVVIFKGPPAWSEDEDGSSAPRSGNAVLRVLQNGASLVGLAAPDEYDLVKRVIAVGGQTVGCCDARHRVVVDGRPLDEPYLYYQPGHGPAHQASFAPVRLAPGQLWVMGDNRNNSSDARDHGPITVADVIGRARFIMWPVDRWRTVPSIDPQQPAGSSP